MRYLTAVAIADLCSLYSWNLNLFYKHLINPYQNDLEDSSLLACRLISFIGFVSLQLSSWYLTLVSIDRCFNIQFLFWHRQLGRASRSVYIILGLTLIIILLNSHLLVLNGYQQSNCTPYAKRTCFICYARLADRHYIFPKWEKIHVVIYNLIPFSIMLVSTCFIIRRSIPSVNIQRTLSIEPSKSSTRSTYRQRKQRQLTCILLSVIFLFVLLTTPVMIYNVFLRNHLQHRKPLKYIVHGVLLCVQFTSHAVGRQRPKQWLGAPVNLFSRSIFSFIVMVHRSFVMNWMNSSRFVAQRRALVWWIQLDCHYKLHDDLEDRHSTCPRSKRGFPVGTLFFVHPRYI